MPGLFNGTFIVLWDDEVCNRKVYNIGRKNLKIPESVNQRRTDNTMAKRRTDNTMAKRKSRKGQTTIYKTLHIKLKME